MNRACIAHVVQVVVVALVAQAASACLPDGATGGEGEGELVVGEGEGEGAPDGAPQRRTCTNSFGSALTADHGRLDGFLTAIVPPTQRGCNADDDHLHLQVTMNGSVYDVSVNVRSEFTTDDRVYFTQQERFFRDANADAWSEGWHTDDPLDYERDLRLESASFTPFARDALVAQLQQLLATANHVSIFMTGYGRDGGHLVHRRGAAEDGAIVLTPLDRPRWLLFRFVDQGF